MGEKKPTTQAYARGKNQGNGGFGDLWVSAPRVSDERWAELDWGNYPKETPESRDMLTPEELSNLPDMKIVDYSR